MRALRPLLLVFGLLLALVSGLQAQDDISQIQHRDFSVSEAQGFFGDEFGDPLTSIFLNELFGPLFPPADRETAQHKTVFSTIIGYFNIVAIGLGGLLFVWNATAGLLQTAHEGELLGRRWSSLWAPMRIVFAVGLLIPLPDLQGYNAAQAGVAYIVRGASMTASTMWRWAAEAVLVGQIPIAAAQPTVAPDLVRAIYGIAVCETMIRHDLAAIGAVSQFRPGAFATRAGSEDFTVLERASFIARGSGRIPVCGRVWTPKFPTDAQKFLAWSGLSEGQIENVVLRFRNGHVAVLERLHNHLRTIALTKAAVILTPRRVSETPLAMPQQLARAVKAANTGLSQVAHDVFELAGANAESAGAANRGRVALDTITGGADCATSAIPGARCFGSGWIMAGSWYVEFARINAQMTALSRAASNAEIDRFLGQYGRSGELRTTLELTRRTGIRESGHMLSHEGALAAWDRFQSSFEYDARQLAALGLDERDESISAPGEDGGWFGLPSVRDFMTDISGVDLRGALGAMTDLILAPGEDPLAGLQAWGEILLGTAVAVQSVLTVAPGAATWRPATGTLWAAGALLQLILPLMPWMLWVVAVTGYFLLVVEAVIGVSLWAFAHLRMDGEGISGAATNGWTLLLALLLTPTLMVFGFIAGMMIFRVTSGLLLAGIVPAAESALGPASIPTLLAALPAVAVFIAIMQLILIERSFSLITELPSRVLSWIGGKADLADQGALDRARIGMIGATASLPRVMPGPEALRAGGRGIARLFSRGGDGRARGGGDRPTQE